MANLVLCVAKIHIWSTNTPTPLHLLSTYLYLLETTLSKASTSTNWRTRQKFLYIVIPLLFGSFEELFNSFASIYGVCGWMDVSLNVCTFNINFGNLSKILLSKQANKHFENLNNFLLYFRDYLFDNLCLMPCFTVRFYYQIWVYAIFCCSCTSERKNRLFHILGNSFCWKYIIKLQNDRVWRTLIAFILYSHSIEMIKSDRG